MSRSTFLWQCVAVVSTLDRFIMSPLLLAMAHDLGVPLSAVVAATAVYFLTYGLSQPLWGLASQRFGIVRTARLALALAGLMSLCSAAAWSLIVLGLFRGLSGGLYGAAYPSSLIYMGETVPARQRQSQIARLMVGVAIGTSAGSLGAGLIASHWSWRVAYVLPGVAALALAWRMGSIAEPRARRSHAPLRRQALAVVRTPTALVLLTFAFFEGGLLFGVLTLMPAAIEHAGQSTAAAGALTALYGCAVFFSSQVVKRISLRWHPSALIAVGGSAAAASAAVFTVSQEVGPAIATSTLLGIAWTFMHSSLQTWATEVVPPARTLFVSLFAGFLFAGSAAQAAAVGGFADKGDFATIYASLFVLAVILTIATATARSRWHRPPAPPMELP